MTRDYLTGTFRINEAALSSDRPSICTPTDPRQLGQLGSRQDCVY